MNGEGVIALLFLFSLLVVAIAVFTDNGPDGGMCP